MVDNNVQEIVVEPKKPRRRFWQGLGILISGLSTVVLIFIVGLTAHHFLMINEELATLVAGLTNHAALSQDALEQNQKALAQVQQTTQQMNDALKTQAQTITDLQQNVHNGKDDLAIAEAEFLVKMANNSLQFENNVGTAIRLLQTADQDLAKLNDPRLYPVREAFSADLAMLHNVPQIDVPGIYLRLSNLSDQLSALPLLSGLNADKNQANSGADDQKLSWWRRGLHSTWQALGQIVIVRKKPVDMPFIAPDQQAFLYENLRSEVEKAEWGLLHRQADIYQASLNHVSVWIQKYAVPTSPVTQQLLVVVGQLQQIDVRAPNVNVMASLQALQNYFNAGGK